MAQDKSSTSYKIWTDTLFTQNSLFEPRNFKQLGVENSSFAMWTWTNTPFVNALVIYIAVVIAVAEIKGKARFLEKWLAQG